MGSVKGKLGLTLFVLLCVIAGIFSYRYVISAEKQQIITSESDTRDYRGMTLDNGMKVLLVSDVDAPKSLAAIALPIGSLDDPDTQLGLAHYLEHMVLMGSEKYPNPDDFSSFLSKHAGSYNASTASYRTAFYLEVAHEALEPAVDRLADALSRPLLDPVNANKERNAVNAEMTLARSRDGMRIGQIGAETLNPKHPIARFSGGNLETLSDKPDSKLQDELITFYQTYYSANLMKGVLYGNQSLEVLAQLADDTFGRIENRNAKVPKINIPVVTEKQQGIEIHYQPVQPQKMLRLEFLVDNTKDNFASKIDTYIAYLLGHRGENTLVDKLLRHGYIEGLSAGADNMIARNSGIFIINVALTEKGLKQQDRIIAEIFHYINRLKHQGVERRYFDEISNVLAIDFHYPSISRDMGYIEWLADNMLRVPFAHVLDSPYLANKFDAKAIKQRLSQLTPQALRLWVISPDEETDNKAYFVDAPYSVKPIAPGRYDLWRTLEQDKNIQLPALNPYIPNHFSSAGLAGFEQEVPRAINTDNGIPVFAMPSQQFSDQPKANVVVRLSQNGILNTAKQQVLFYLNDYLAEQALSRLAYQAGVAGLSFSTSSHAGLRVSVSGFNQHLPELFAQLLSAYAEYQGSESQLAQAKATYREAIAGENKGNAFNLAHRPLMRLNSIDYTESASRLALLDALTLEDVISYRDHLLSNSAPEVLVIGALTKPQINTITQSIKNIVKPKSNVIWRGEKVGLNRDMKVNYQYAGSSSDSALDATYIALNKPYFKSRVTSNLLARVLHTWFYDQLRSKEQLGYAVFVTPSALGDNFGLSFLLQSNEKQPAQLYQRYLAFYQQAEQRLASLTDASFKEYQQGLLAELTQKPQTLDEQAMSYMGDFNRGNVLFDSKDKLIAAAQEITKEDLINTFNEIVIQQKGFVMLSQISGQAGNTAYATLPDAKTYQDTVSLQSLFSRYAVTATLDAKDQ